MSGCSVSAASSCVRVSTSISSGKRVPNQLPRAAHSFGDGLRSEAERGEMIVLDEDAVAETQAMIVSAAAAHRVFLQHAPARRRLAGVENLHRQIGDERRVAPRLRGDAAEPLKEIQRRAFAGEDGAHPPGNGGELRAALHARTIGDERRENECWIDGVKAVFRRGQPGDDTLGPHDEHGTAIEIGGDDGETCEIAITPKSSSSAHAARRDTAAVSAGLNDMAASLISALLQRG